MVLREMCYYLQWHRVWGCRRLERGYGAAAEAPGKVMQKYFYRPALVLLLGVPGFATIASAQ